ncbi:MAG: hypothetical protein RL308_2100 [Bacteroidota bacterium]|jgi:hypothetical protein
MIQYIKLILEKVSFDRYLFEKELLKAIKIVVPDEFNELKNWCYEKFSHQHMAILKRHFETVPMV